MCKCWSAKDSSHIWLYMYVHFKLAYFFENHYSKMITHLSTGWGRPVTRSAISLGIFSGCRPFSLSSTVALLKYRPDYLSVCQLLACQPVSLSTSPPVTLSVFSRWSSLSAVLLPFLPVWSWLPVILYLAVYRKHVALSTSQPLRLSPWQSVPGEQSICRPLNLSTFVDLTTCRITCLSTVNMSPCRLVNLSDLSSRQRVPGSSLSGVLLTFLPLWIWLPVVLFDCLK